MSPVLDWLVARPSGAQALALLVLSGTSVVTSLTIIRFLRAMRVQQTLRVTVLLDTDGEIVSVAEKTARSGDAPIPEP